MCFAMSVSEDVGVSAVVAGYLCCRFCFCRAGKRESNFCKVINLFYYNIIEFNYII